MAQLINTALSTRALSVGYHKGNVQVPILENLELSLIAGELVCFMGPNGIGKSTLIRTLAGLQRPLSGNIYHKNDKDLPRQISVVLTDRIAATNLSAYELIAIGRYPYLNWTIKLNEEDKRIIDVAVEQTNIKHLLAKKLYELSDGQLQMVMIARALAQDGGIILLDEPTAHLDLNNRVEIMNLLRKLSRTTNKAILVATHELDLALQTADLIWLAGKNKTILTGMPEDLVLNGSFDEVFQFKGFDLRTGKIQHEPHRGISVNVIGTGPELLWTKNALERNGFNIEDNAKTTIHVLNEGGCYSWVLAKDGATISLPSLSAVINSVQ